MTAGACGCWCPATGWACRGKETALPSPLRWRPGGPCVVLGGTDAHGKPCDAGGGSAAEVWPAAVPGSRVRRGAGSVVVRGGAAACPGGRGGGAGAAAAGDLPVVRHDAGAAAGHDAAAPSVLGGGDRDGAAACRGGDAVDAGRRAGRGAVRDGPGLAAPVLPPR